MTELLHVQIALKAQAQAIYQALTDNLAVWFAEYADVSTAEKRYDFWGRFTPGTPTREEGRHPLLAYEPGKHLNFEWRSHKFDSTVDIQIIPRDERNLVVVQQGNPNNPTPDIGVSTDTDNRGCLNGVRIRETVGSECGVIGFVPDADGEGGR